MSRGATMHGQDVGTDAHSAGSGPSTPGRWCSRLSRGSRIRRAAGGRPARPRASPRRSGPRPGRRRPRARRRGSEWPARTLASVRPSVSSDPRGESSVMSSSPEAGCSAVSSRDAVLSGSVASRSRRKPQAFAGPKAHRGLHSVFDLRCPNHGGVGVRAEDRAVSRDGCRLKRALSARESTERRAQGSAPDSTTTRATARAS
jgi:hypothetical protein